MGNARLPGPLSSSIQNLGIDLGTLCRSDSPRPGPTIGLPGMTGVATAPDVGGKLASNFSMSGQALALLKQLERLALKPYDDQTGKEISAWTAGATIGYGHLIKKGDWDTYKAGITASGADTLFNSDLAPFVLAVQSKIKVCLKQNQFDALVILTFNIGTLAFSGSSVVTLVNDPKASTTYKNLEAAWKAWNKSQGKVMKGLENRRQAEWNIYAHGVYSGW